jgi:hypothetical protein
MFRRSVSRPRKWSRRIGAAAVFIAAAWAAVAIAQSDNDKYGPKGDSGSNNVVSTPSNFNPNSKYPYPANLPATTMGPANVCFQLLGDIPMGESNSDDFDWWSELMPGWFGAPSYAFVQANDFVSPPTNVKPYNTHAIPIHDLCSGYLWSQRTFMWLTSPSDEGGYIFDSPMFFEVQGPDANGLYTMAQNQPTKAPRPHTRATKAGPLGLPVVLDRQGRLLGVVEAAPAKAVQVRDATGRLVAVAHAQIGGDGRLSLFDGAHRPIAYAQAPTAAPAHEVEFARPDASAVSCALCVQRAVIDGQTVFTDPHGAVVDVDAAQATGGVLMAQPRHGQKTGSLVYYSIYVNDVMAYFATGVRDGAIKLDHFPASEDDLKLVEKFAADHGKSFHKEHGQTDRGQLAVEVKAAWVEADALPDGCNAITRDAVIPTYDTSDARKWVPNGEKTAKLALVGMHVVGSVVDHPEMVWSTFENFCNAPNAAYDYFTGSKRRLAQDTSGAWIFAADKAKGPFNKARMTIDGANIIATDSIGPSNVLRAQPFGSPSDDAADNSVLVDIAQNMLGRAYQNADFKPNHDIRGNYFLVGAMWTFDGGAPSLQNRVGSISLTNSTMETFIQGQGVSCFSCHVSSSPTKADTGESHIFGALKPLFDAH